jgi:hypothetical protein
MDSLVGAARAPAVPTSPDQEGSVTIEAPPAATVGVKALPPDNSVQITDALAADHLEQMYSIGIGPTTVSVAIELQANVPGAPVVEGMTLIDGQGHELASRMPPPGCLSLSINLPAPPLRDPRAWGNVLFLRLAAPSGVFGMMSQSGSAVSAPAPGNSAFAPATLGYVLSVQRVSASIAPVLPTGDATPQYTEGVQASGQLDVPATPATPVVAIVPGVRTGGSEVAPPDTGRVVQPVAVAVGTGSLPGRAAGPLGGTLSPGDEETVTDRTDPAVVDLALMDLPSEQVDRGDLPSAGAARGGADRRGESTALAAVRGPGGFPLFGSALQTEASPERMSMPLAVAGVIAAAPPVVIVPATPSGPIRETRPQKARTVRSVSIVAGLSAGCAMATSLVLPDLTDPLRRGSTLRRRLGRRPVRVDMTG